MHFQSDVMVERCNTTLETNVKMFVNVDRMMDRYDQRGDLGGLNEGDMLWLYEHIRCKGRFPYSCKIHGRDDIT